MIGRRFGRLTVISGPEKTRSGHRWACLCDCGGTKSILFTHLNRGSIKSCGCIRATQQGLGRTKLCGVWRSMVSRCVNTADTAAKNYKLRGIAVCDTWQKSFTSFRDWALSHGYRGGLEIDRRDNDGPYSPENCRFITRLDNIHNQRLLRRNNTTGFCGVTKDKAFEGFVAQVQIRSVPRLFRRGFPTAHQAAVARDLHILRHTAPIKLNFPELALQGPL